MSESLTKTAFSALRWNYAGFVIRSICTFVIGIVLARLLGPKPFGQVAAVALVFGLANLIADSGFSAALVQAPSLSDVGIRFAFTVQVLSAMAITTATVLGAPYLALAFHDPEIQTVLRGIAPLFLIQSFGQTSTGLLKRQLAHKKVQGAQISSYLVGYLLVGVPAACLGAGVWSLVAAQLVQAVSYVAQVYRWTRHSIVPSLDRSAMRLLRFGTQVTGANTVNWSISNLDNIVVGHGFGSTSLGLYSRAFNLASVPSDGLVSTCQQVLFASCSRAARRVAPIRRAYLAAMSALATILLPLYWSMAACPDTVVLGLYGTRWTGVAPLFRVFAIALPLNALMALAGPPLGATDRVKLELRAQMLSLAFAATAFAIAVRYSPAAVAWAVLGAYVFRYVVVTAPTLRVLGISWRDVFRVTRGPIAAGLATSSLVFAVQRIEHAHAVPPGLALALLGITGVMAVGAIVAAAPGLVFSPELVELLGAASPALPRFAASLLQRAARRHGIAGKTDRAASNSGPANRSRVWIATLMSKTGETGVQTHFNTLRQYLERQGTPIDVLTPFEAPRTLGRICRLISRLIKMAHEEAGRYADLRLAHWLLRIRLRGELPNDQTWTVYAQCPGSALVALGCRTRIDQRVVMIVHFNLSQAEEMADRGRIRRGGWVYRWIQRNEKRALLGVDTTIYCSEFMRAHLASAIDGLSRRPCQVVQNFVNVPHPAADGPTADIITIGTLEPRKNQGALLEILAEANQQGRRYSLTIVGSGESESSLRGMAAGLGLAGQVAFAGYVPEASRLLQGHRVYAHAAKMENLPITLIEALSVGLPVLAPAVGGIPEIVTDGVEGFLWDTSDVKACARALIGVLDGAEVYRSMSAAARSTYELKFRAEERAAEVWAVLSNSPSSAYSSFAVKRGALTAGAVEARVQGGC